MLGFQKMCFDRMICVLWQNVCDIVLGGYCVEPNHCCIGNGVGFFSADCFENLLGWVKD